MAINTPAMTVTMLDAEFVSLNDGVAAPTITKTGTFGYLDKVTAASAAGTTTLTVPAGIASIRERNALMRRVHRLKVGGSSIVIN